MRLDLVGLELSRSYGIVTIETGETMTLSAERRDKTRFRQISKRVEAEC